MSNEPSTTVGPSRDVRWTMPDGTTHTATPKTNPRVSCLAEWKVIMCGANVAECLDAAGNVTHRFTKEDAEAIRTKAKSEGRCS